MAQNIKDIFLQNQYDLKKASIRSKAWFQQQTTTLKRQNITAQKVLNSNSNKVTRQVTPGSLYMFLYDPKTKDTDQDPILYADSLCEERGRCSRSFSHRAHCWYKKTT